MRRFPGNRVELVARLPTGLASAEIGVMAGDFSSAIFQREPTQHIMIDAWRTQPGADRVSSAGQLYHDLYYKWVLKRFALQLRHGVGEVWKMTAAEAFLTLPKNLLDWVYVDGDHRYNAVITDLRGAVQLIKPDGFIAGHDYGGGAQVISVIRAVRDFLDENKDMCLVLLTNERSHVSYVITYKTMEPHYAKLFMGEE